MRSPDSGALSPDSDPEQFGTVEQRLRFHMEHTPLAVIEWDGDLRIARWSGAAERIFGWRAEEVLGKRIEDFKFVHLDDVPNVKSVTQELDEKGRSQAVSRNRNYRKDGSVIWCEWYNSKIQDSSGTPISTLSLVLDVTERHAAETALRERAEELRKLLEVVPAVVWVAHDPKCQVITGNRRGNELLQSNEGENVSSSTRPELNRQFDKNGRELSPDVLPLQQAAATNREIHDAEIDIELGNGVRRTIFGSAAPLRNEAGEARGAVGAFIDITSRKAIEDALRSSEAQFRTLANALPQLCWIAHRDGSIFWYNDRWYEYTGATPEQMKGWGWQSVHDAEYLPKVLERWKASIDSGEPFEMVFPLRGRDGRYRQFLTRISPVKDEAGTVVRWFGSNTDVTEEREAQERLRQALEQLQESESRFRAFVNASCDVVYRMSADWSEMRELDGRGFIASTEEPKRDWIKDYIYPDDEATLQAAIQRAIDSKSMFALEHRVRRADETMGWTFSRAVPILDANGDIVEWFGTASDITARRLAELALIRTEKLASVGRLAATISHEINNPLEAVTNLLYLIRRDAELPERLREQVRAAEGELSRAAHMAKRTLSFVRVESRAYAFPVSELVEDVLRLLSPMLTNRGVNVTKRLDPRSQTVGVANELRQVCINLISNAVDSGTKTLHVRVSQRSYWTRDGNKAVRITIADRGSGIPKEQQNRIFEPFFTTKQETGTGLGLWVCHEIVNKLGGAIRMRSTVGKGTVFSVYLPTGLPTEQ